MIFRFLGNLMQVKLSVLVVIVCLLLAECIDSFSQNFQQSNEVCRKCNDDNRKLTSMLSGKLEGRTRYLCAIYEHFLSCVQPLKNECKPDLNFQGGISLVRAHRKNHNCDKMNMTRLEVLSIIDKIKNRMRNNVTSQKGCRRPKFRPVYKVCGLFGDPHLRTFSDDRHTCSVPGAWPLFANRYLTVQVTNEPLKNGSRATATSKITVIVRGLKNKCIEEKMYQARSFSLPSVFSDGTRSSENKECPTRIKELEKGRRVMLDICLLKTKIIIQQVGKYLTVHMRVPKGLTKRKTIGLCQKGCPRIEQMNLDEKSPVYNLMASFRKDPKLSKRFPRRRQERAKRICREAKITGFYYKSCLFDFLMSNNESFVEAAIRAMKDFKTINKDDYGRPIVNESARDFFTGQEKHDASLLTTTQLPRDLSPSSTSSAFTIHKLIHKERILWLALALLYILQALR